MIHSIIASTLLVSFASCKAIVGVNIGGWLVLEPWITPSLFYRFLGKPGPKEVAIDSYTFCEALGPVEGNKVMNAHWDTWYTEEHIANLSIREVTMVRLPIGDWTLNPYGPYKGCMDGADKRIDWFLDTAAKYNITVWMDVHTAPGSQNGFDNSGMAHEIYWFNETHYSLNGMATWLSNATFADEAKTQYHQGPLNFDHLQFSIKNAEDLLIRFGNHSAFGGYQPVNEPWWNTPLQPLKEFYREVRKLVRRYAPQALFIFHDSFRFSAAIWNDLFVGDWEKTVLDTHYYYAFNQDITELGNFCTMTKNVFAQAKDFLMPIFVGEWSLATDNCAQHLNGFNNGRIFTRGNYWACAQMECPQTYMKEQVVEFDRTVAKIAPYGINGDGIQNTIQQGKCWTDSLHYDQNQVRLLAECTLKAFNDNLHGMFMWTGHNEIEARWDWIKSWDMMWVNQTEVPVNMQKEYPDFVPYINTTGSMSDL